MKEIHEQKIPKNVKNKREKKKKEEKIGLEWVFGGFKLGTIVLQPLVSLLCVPKFIHVLSNLDFVIDYIGVVQVPLFPMSFYFLETLFPLFESIVP